MAGGSTGDGACVAVSNDNDLQYKSDVEVQFRHSHDSEGEVILAFSDVRGPNDGILIEVQEGTQVHYDKPYWILAKIPEKLEKMAEGTMDLCVREAVIAILASFNDAQQEDTRKAAAEAGLSVLRLVTKPTATAIAEGYATQPHEPKMVVMFDLCENPLDVSLMTIQDKFYSVLAVSGDAHLEGRDFDLQLIKFCLERFDPTGRTRMEDLHSHQLNVLKSQCEVTKYEFTSTERTMVDREEFQTDEDLDIRITRKEFEVK
jgi:molecular chaperone DnaK (HSP70)